MKITVSYKQSWVSEKVLNKNLSFLRENIEKLGHSSFIYYLDEDSSLEASKINRKVLENIQNSDLIMWFINHKEKSEWQLLELGMAYALWKKIILLVNKRIKDNYYLIYWLNAKIIYFDMLGDLDFKKILW